MKRFLNCAILSALLCAPCSESQAGTGVVATTSNCVNCQVIGTTQATVVQQQVPITVTRQRTEMVDVQREVVEFVPQTKTITVQEPRIVEYQEQVMATVQSQASQYCDCVNCTCVNCQCSLQSQSLQSNQLTAYTTSQAPVVDSGVHSVQKARAVSRTRGRLFGRLRARRDIAPVRVQTLGIEARAGGLQSRAQAAANALASRRTTSHNVTRPWRPSNVFEGTGYASGGRMPPTCVPWEYGSSKRNLVADAVTYDGGGRAYRVRWWA